MPTRSSDGGTPVVEFDPRLEVSPFTLFRRLKEGRGPELIDVRRQRSGRTLRGARPWPGGDWCPEPEREVLLFDEDGREALPLVERLQAAGCHRARMLFGGLELYAFALSPEVVGEETFLEEIPRAD